MSMRLKKPVILATHHKTGTVLLLHVFKDICAETGLEYSLRRRNEGWVPADINHFESVQVDVSTLPAVFAGIHTIRDPRSLWVSSYLYHKKCSEEWCLKPREEEGGRSYQQVLNSLGTAEGLLFELDHVAGVVIGDMYNWDYSDGRFLNVKMEDVMSDYDNVFKRIFSHTGFKGLKQRKYLKIAARHDVGRRNKDELEKIAHVQNKDMKSDYWREYLNADLLAELDRRYPADLFERLGYRR